MELNPPPSHALPMPKSERRAHPRPLSTTATAMNPGSSPGKGGGPKWPQASTDTMAAARAAHAAGQAPPSSPTSSLFLDRLMSLYRT